MYAKAYAKINVYLDVKGKLDNGYHDLDMVMLPLELHDVIEIEYLPYLTDSFIVCDRVENSGTKYDLIHQTLDAFKKKFDLKKQNFNITVHKEIPICAGLGGGSSNAAACLKAFKKILKIKMDPEEELKFTLALGADVPYCMKNVPAHVEGIGEKVTPINCKNQFHVIIIKPKLGCLTKKVFQECDKHEFKHGNVNDVIKALETGDEELLSKSMFNSLEETSIGMVPEIQDIKDMLKKDGFKCVLMTGSGSCVFALTTDRKMALTKYAKYDHKGYDVYLTKTLKQ